MEFNEYMRLAQRTSGSRSAEDKLHNACLGLAGESGECCDILKKHVHQGHGLDREHFAEELGDVLWYIAEGCAALNIDMDEVAENNIAKLMARYPDGFDSERSVNRAEAVKPHWVVKEDANGKYALCSECRKGLAKGEVRMNLDGLPYCPSCGKRMKGETVRE